MTLQCWKCRQDIELEDKIMRGDTCPHCGTDMRCCYNCRFYDPGHHNQCRENISEYIEDRGRANFCSAFMVRTEPAPEAGDPEAAKVMLDALFKK
ncbi:MAG: hypothetical protein GXP49_13150 [Deltaproteobacteria bacterium]|nr:hypothetical protein [Deltaproteobacteria bacterium]